MANSERDEFSAGVKRTLAERVGWLCSFPNCGQATSGPSHESTGKSVKNGTAAHITAASEGGRRYDGTLTEEQRAGIENGIWMCPTHGSLIDKEETTYTVTDIRRWKIDAEARAYRNLERCASEAIRDQQVQASTKYSEKDSRTLKAYADTLNFNFIQRLKQEFFGSIVLHATTNPLDVVLSMKNDPKYHFQDNELESLRSTLNSRISDFYKHFGQQSGGNPQHWDYINIEEFSRHSDLPREYWEKEVEKTQDLAALVCETALEILTIRENLG